MQSAHTGPEPLWSEAAPHLDEALNRLNSNDRQALLLRFFDRKSMRDIGQLIGVTEEAAKMRVNRALERLRQQLARSGVACTTVSLATVLGGRAVEAAPAAFAAKLAVGRFAAPAAAGINAGLLKALLLISKEKLAVGSLVLLTIAISIAVFVRSTGRPDPNVVQEPSGSSADIAERQASYRRTIQANQIEPMEIPAPANVRLLFRIVDAETGEGLAGVAVRAVYFYAGGRGEPHTLVSDRDGRVTVPNALEENDRGFNLFVSLDGYVPKTAGRPERKPPPEENIMLLEPARTVSGTVVDEAGAPIDGVKIRAQRSGDYKEGMDNVDFQTVIVTSDANGRWSYPYIPKDYEDVRLILTHDDYAVAVPWVPFDKVDAMNLMLIMEPGFTVVGQITDPGGRPIPGASVREVHGSSYRRLAATTDYDGRFTLKGVWAEYGSWQQHPIETNSAGMTRMRGLKGIGEAGMKLAVQAEGFAAELRSLELREPVTVANFVLGEGRVFRGRIVDDAGRPIPDAVVRTDTDDHGIRNFHWTGYTDSGGRFEWSSAPAEPVLFWFEADREHEWLREVLLVPDGTEYEIVLKRRK